MSDETVDAEIKLKFNEGFMIQQVSDDQAEELLAHFRRNPKLLDNPKNKAFAAGINEGRLHELNKVRDDIHREDEEQSAKRDRKAAKYDELIKRLQQRDKDQQR